MPRLRLENDCLTWLEPCIIQKHDVILSQCNTIRVRDINRYRTLRWLGHVARTNDTRLPKMLLFGHLDTSRILQSKLEGYILEIRKRGYTVVGLSYTCGHPRIGQHGEVPYVKCCNAPDLGIGTCAMKRLNEEDGLGQIATRLVAMIDQNKCPPFTQIVRRPGGDRSSGM